MNATTAAKTVVVRGRVQGVFFRDSTRRVAEAEGVAGWVLNLGDGRVQAHFEGAADAVDRVVTWCRSGPPRAVVTDVEVRAVEPEDCDRFEVRY